MMRHRKGCGHNLRASLNALRRSPWFVVVTVGSLALAFGVASAVFAIVSAVLVPSVAIRDVDRVLVITARGDGAHRIARPADLLAELKRAVSSIDEMVVTEQFYLLAEGTSLGSQVLVRRVPPGFFRLLGVEPAVGRFFTPDASRAELDATAVIGHRIWRRHFGSARSLEDASITVDGKSYAVIGVAPDAMSSEDATAVYLAADASSIANPAGISVPQAFVRLRDGASPASAQRQSATLAASLTERFGSGRYAFGFTFLALAPDELALRDIHFAFIAAGVAVVLIACANLANLVLARSIARGREFAIRRALGARRGDIIRDILLECMIVSFAGALLGLLLAAWALALLERAMPSNVPYLGDLTTSVDGSVFAFAVVASIAAAVMFGIGPALRASDLDLTTPLKDGSGGATTRTKGRYSALVVAEVALCLALVTSAGLLMRASERVRALDFGYDRNTILEGMISSRRWKETPSRDVATLFEGLVHKVRALPNVEAAAWSTWYSGDSKVATSALAGGGNRSIYQPLVRVVSSEYLHVLGIPVVAGRDFQLGDAVGDGKAIVDERVARELWPGESPIGQRVALGDPRGGVPWFSVVGVAKRVRESLVTLDFYDGGPGVVYVSVAPGAGARTIVVRANESRQADTKLALLRLFRDAVPRGFQYSVRALRERYDQVSAAHAFLANVFAGLAVLAVLTCAVGVFCVLSYAGAQRQRDFAVRIALGATDRDIFMSVVRDAGVMVLAGTAVGGFLAMWSSRLIDPLLFDLYRIDALTLIVSEGVVVIAAFGAGIVPAWRATRASALDLLRSA